MNFGLPTVHSPEYYVFFAARIVCQASESSAITPVSCFFFQTHRYENHHHYIGHYIHDPVELIPKRTFSVLGVADTYLEKRSESIIPNHGNKISEIRKCPILWQFGFLIRTGYGFGRQGSNWHQDGSQCIRQGMRGAAIDTGWREEVWLDLW